MINFKEIDSEEIASLLAIIIGGVIAITHPEYMDDAFHNTVVGIILIKLFWR